MAKPGIRILEERIGTGTPVAKGDTVVIVYDLALNQGDVVQSNERREFVLGDRDVIAGLNYGIEGMKWGGRRKFKASPHLCYRDAGVPDKIPAGAVLVFDVTLLKITNRAAETA